MGPSQEYAYQVGDKIADEVIALLAEKHHIREPFPERVFHSFPAGYGNQLQSEWEDNVKKLREAIRELVWTDHAQF